MFWFTFFCKYEWGCNSYQWSRSYLFNRDPFNGTSNAALLRNLRGKKVYLFSRCCFLTLQRPISWTLICPEDGVISDIFVRFPFSCLEFEITSVFSFWSHMIYSFPKLWSLAHSSFANVVCDCPNVKPTCWWFYFTSVSI